MILAHEYSRSSVFPVGRDDQESIFPDRGPAGIHLARDRGNRLASIRKMHYVRLFSSHAYASAFNTQLIKSDDENIGPCALRLRQDTGQKRTHGIRDHFFQPAKNIP